MGNLNGEKWNSESKIDNEAGGTVLFFVYFFVWFCYLGKVT